MGLLDLPGQPQRYGLLSPDAMGMIQRLASAPPPAAQTPQRGRVSGWRVFDRVLGGQTVTEGLDAERERLRQEALRPEMEARQAAIRAFAQSQGPVAMAALATNPDEFGKAMASNLEGYTLGAGGVRGGIGGRVASAPTFSTVNDTIYRNDPGAGTSTATATAPAAFSDQTARFNAENPVLSAGSTWVGPDGKPRAQGFIAPEVVSTPAGGTTNVIDPRTGQVINSVQGNAKPLTAMDRRQLREDQDAIRTAEEITTNLDNLIGQIDRGDLNLGPLTNMLSQGRNAAGMSDQNSRNFASFRASLEKLRNDSLRLNTGVQTDGDSRRAWDELVANINDEKVVAQRLAEIRDINRRAIEYRRARIADASQDAAAPGAAASAAPVIAEDAQGNRVQWNGSAWVPM